MKLLLAIALLALASQTAFGGFLIAPNAHVVVGQADKDGNILFGREPSVAECESYNGPNLLQPLYSRKE